MLAVNGSIAAVDFYKRALGATEAWRIDDGAGSLVVELMIAHARFYVAEQDVERAVISPTQAGGTTVRLSLSVTNPWELQSRAIDAGATEILPVGPQPWLRRGDVQGIIVDPFGHKWLINGHPNELTQT